MLAVDTNVIIRYLVVDDSGQAARARRLINERDVFVCTTVLLETAWVLRRGYRFTASETEAIISGFVGLPNVVLENSAAVAKALEWMRKGLDFADALHLAASGQCEAFITFDREFAKLGTNFGGIAVRTP